MNFPKSIIVVVFLVVGIPVLVWGYQTYRLSVERDKAEAAVFAECRVYSKPTALRVLELAEPYIDEHDTAWLEAKIKDQDIKVRWSPGGKSGVFMGYIGVIRRAMVTVLRAQAHDRGAPDREIRGMYSDRRMLPSNCLADGLATLCIDIPARIQTSGFRDLHYVQTMINEAKKRLNDGGVDPMRATPPPNDG